MEHTKGECKKLHRITDDEGNYNTQVYTKDTVICTLKWAGHKEKDGTITSRRGANAKLIAEAFNVANETGKTPRQLANERTGLLEALKWAIGDMDRLSKYGLSYSMSLGKTPLHDSLLKEAKIYEDMIVNPIKKATETN